MMKPSHHIDVSGVGLGASLLQTRNGVSCPRDMVPDNNILRPTAFTSKSLSSTDKKYSNIEREALSILQGLEKIPSLLLWKRGEHNYRPQATGGNIQGRCGNIITKITVNAPQDTPV